MSVFVGVCMTILIFGILFLGSLGYAMKKQERILAKKMKDPKFSSMFEKSHPITGMHYSKADWNRLCPHLHTESEDPSYVAPPMLYNQPNQPIMSYYEGCLRKNNNQVTHKHSDVSIARMDALHKFYKVYVDLDIKKKECRLSENDRRLINKKFTIINKEKLQQCFLDIAADAEKVHINSPLARNGGYHPFAGFDNYRTEFANMFDYVQGLNKQDKERLVDMMCGVGNITKPNIPGVVFIFGMIFKDEISEGIQFPARFDKFNEITLSGEIE